MDQSLCLTIFQKTIILTIQEQTLTFVPKIFAALIILIVTAPWITDVFVSRTKEIFEYIKVFIS